MSPARKAMVIGVIILVLSGFVLMFYWANQVDYQTLYTNLASDDAAAIISKLKEDNIPYKIEAEGSIIKVPVERVYELRLALASEGLPKGDSVGFEVFDNTTFSTTEFVQKLNYQRALQGELARTICQFEEVDHARVMLVMPEESLFIEDAKPPSASVLLKLRSSLPKDKVDGVVHLVASSVEGLEPHQITVVDTSGAILYKNESDEEEAMAKMQTEYQRKIEQRYHSQIQTMLERIVGEGKAIVRVSADIDFNQIDLREEKYDPDSSAIRSEQHKAESAKKERDEAQGNTEVESGSENQDQNLTSLTQKSDKIVNYEVSHYEKRVSKPFGEIKRLSVASVVDGVYQMVKAEDGSEKLDYQDRSEQELQKLEELVKKAMGYSADREDQIQVTCMRFSITAEDIFPKERNWLVYGRPYIRPILNLVLVLLIFFFVVRPFLKAFRQMAQPPEPEEDDRLPELPEPEEAEGLPDIAKMSLRERVIMIANNYPEKTENWVRGWINEVEKNV
ncbi:flagellar M-ring protein FliF [Candidatus Magnetomorum sp. HK-1]|nr:flagellar M-ring protein FliF [Candidatus Magnetomorum sp. HK-1]